MKACVLSGGGSKGAHTVGALQHLLIDLDIQYDIICGVSVGAINGAFLAQFPKGEERQAAVQLKQMWEEINTSRIYKRWQPFGRWHALWKKSFYDSSPLHQLIREKIDLTRIRESGKQISVGTVSLSSGKYTVFDQTSEYFIEAVIASASFPGMLEPVSFLDQLWTDGGVKEMSPLKRAVDLGANEIDILYTSPHTRIPKFLANPSTVDVLKRSFDLSTDKIMSNDIEKVHLHNEMALAGLSDKKLVKLNVIRPEFNLIEDLLDFNPEKIQEMMRKGYIDAKSRLTMQ